MIKELLLAIGLAQAVPYDSIIAATDPLVLGLAVGADAGTLSTLPLSYATWLHLSRENWEPEVQATTGATPAEIETALWQFVVANRGKDTDAVIEEQTLLHTSPVTSKQTAWLATHADYEKIIRGRTYMDVGILDVDGRLQPYDFKTREPNVMSGKFMVGRPQATISVP